MIEHKYKLELFIGPGGMRLVRRVHALLSAKYPKGIAIGELLVITLSELLDNHSPECRIKKRAERRKKRKDKSAAGSAKSKEKISDRGNGEPGSGKKALSGEKDIPGAGIVSGENEPSGKQQLPRSSKAAVTDEAPYRY